MPTLQETLREVFAPSRSESEMSICVAGTSQVGKTSLLKAMAEFDSPTRKWAESGGLDFLRHKDGYVLKSLNRAVEIRGDQPPPTTTAYQLAILHWTPKNGEPSLSVEINDLAGTQFQALGGPDLGVLSVVDATTLLQKADVILVMIAPEEIVDLGSQAGDEHEEITDLRERLPIVLASLTMLMAARVENQKHPAVFCIFTKADEYAIPWEEMRRVWTLEKASALAKAETVRPEEARFAQVFRPCKELFTAVGQLAGSGVCRVYFSAAQPEDPGFGRTFDAVSVTTSLREERLREGWGRRGVVQLFSDAFEFLYCQRGRPWRGWVTFLACILIVLSLLTVHDVVAGNDAYHREWGEFAQRGVTGHESLQKHFAAARLSDTTHSGDYNTLFRDYYTDRGRTWKNPEWLFPGCFSLERLRRDFKAARGQTMPGGRDPLAWCERPDDFKSGGTR